MPRFPHMRRFSATGIGMATDANQEAVCPDTPLGNIRVSLDTDMQR
jgi:hypothetical protein